ncbi:MAG: HD domain-containing protein [Verrucomicrobiaceae bacterium]|nr:HD domain-containing protein [Verrucomicrobiales bacterium]NCF92517.1 HD domain-containing protein [Verrucomicrobiaceae bacterium]
MSRPDEMEPISIKELKGRAGESPVQADLQVQLAQTSLKETRNGKAYRELVCADAEGSLTLRVWSDHPMFSKSESLNAQQFLLISGQWVDKGPFGIEPKSWDFRDLTADEQEEMLRGPESLRAKQSQDYEYIQRSVSALADPRLRLVSRHFLETYGERFLRTAAARTYHHARRGGLVEHVAQMMRAATSLLLVYPRLNADLVITGVLFHDCGKLWENSYLKNGFTMPYNEMGELLGHIPLGIELINKLWRELASDESIAEEWESLTPSTEDVRSHLLHLVASHHGTLEFGSPIVPKTPEAMLLHFVDNIDAKLEMFNEGYEKSALIGKNVYDRQRPLFHTLIQPLEKCGPSAQSDKVAAASVTEPATSSASPDTAGTTFAAKNALLDGNQGASTNEGSIVGGKEEL